MIKNVYILFIIMSSFCYAQSPYSVICNDKAITDNFSKVNNSKNWHEYIVGPTKVCNTLENPLMCTKDKVYETLLSRASMIAPGAGNMPVINCNTYSINTALGVVKGNILVKTVPEEYVVENFTKPGHSLHPGKLYHQIVQIDKDIYIISKGVGNGDYSLLNKWGASYVWGPVHKELVSNVAKQLNQSTIEELPKVNWIKKPEVNASSESNIPSKNKSNCGFYWQDWDQVNDAEKIAMKKVMVSEYESEPKSLYSFISQEINKGIKIKVAKYNFFNKLSYVVYRQHKQPINGAKGQVDVFVGKGESYLSPNAIVKDNLCDVRPINTSQKKGIVSDNGQIAEFMGDLFFDQEYSKFIKSENKAIDKELNAGETTSDCGSRLGARTGEELAVLLLKCLKNNDKSTWIKCMHPSNEVETDELSAKKFERHREQLQASGITNWSDLHYSRHTYPLRPTGGSKVDPTQTIPMSTIEVTYKNKEYAGHIQIGTFVFCSGKWLVWFSGYPEDNRIYRNFGR